MTTKRGTSKKRNTKKDAISKTRDIDLRFILPPELPIHYVDNIQVTHTPSDFLISFMQSRPPLLTSETEWDTVKAIESVCVARVLLNPLKMQAFVQALNSNFKKWFENYFQQEQANENKDSQTGNGANARKPV